MTKKKIIKDYDVAIIHHMHGDMYCNRIGYGRKIDGGGIQITLNVTAQYIHPYVYLLVANVGECDSMIQERRWVIMAQGNKPDFDVFVSQENGDKHWYTNVGAGWHVAKDGISIKLKALPIDGNLVLFPHKNGSD